MTDSFDRKITYLRLSVTDRCNLRCVYCMPEKGVPLRSHSDMLSFEEMVCAVKVCAELGVKKVRITGGEPLVKKNIAELCGQISAVDGVEELCITTNGVMLPSLARNLRDAGVSRVNISLDTLCADKYRKITRCGELRDAWRGIEAALEAGFERVKLNCVLIGGFNDDEIENLASLTLKYPLDVRFIELMPMVAGFGKECFVPSSVVLDKLPSLAEAGTSGVAREFAFEGAKGRVGLISPVSDLFCSSCNRIRILSDGRVKPCLHSSEEFCLKGLTEEEMKDVVRRAVMSKGKSHGLLSAESLSAAGRSMNEIGG